MRIYHCATENTGLMDLVARKTESEIATGHELTVEVSSVVIGETSSSISLCPTVQGCLALLALMNVTDFVWLLLQPGEGYRWVLTDVDTCIRARTIAFYSLLNWQPVQEVANVSSEYII